MFFKKSLELPTAQTALPGRAVPVLAAGERHFVNGRPLHGPWPEGLQTALFAMGCFWGVERIFWKIDGVWTTAVGYLAGITPNPTYEEVCSGRTGHTEAVLVVFDPAVVTYDALLRAFWENHDPTQGMRQGNDLGTQYRSGIYVTSDTQRQAANMSRQTYDVALQRAGFDRVTTEVLDAPAFYYAEAYHQQYLAKNPDGYCGLGGTGVTCAIGTGVKAG